MAQRIDTSARMSKVVIHNNVAYLSGQVPQDRQAPFVLQCQSVLHKIDQLLQSVGGTRSQMLSATIYLKDMADFDQMNAVWEAWVPAGSAPSRTTVKAEMNTPETLIEITVIAYINDDSSGKQQ